MAKLQRALAGIRGTSSQLEDVIGAMSPASEAPRRRGLGSLLSRGDQESHAVYEALQERVAVREGEVVAEPEQADEPTKNGKKK